jgi:hypothetical protein
MKFTKMVISIAAAGLLFPAAFAQESNATINQRKENQQQRIGNGVENGSLTAGEASRLEKKEAGLNREERRMKSDGNFTRAERARIQRQQNAMSRQIYRQKHDGQVQRKRNGYINARKDNQQNRIGEGVKNDSLTAGEAAKLEGREAHINREERRMKSDGNFTPAEKAKINRQQNRTSKAIYKQKHDVQHQ